MKHTIQISNEILKEVFVNVNLEVIFLESRLRTATISPNKRQRISGKEEISNSVTTARPCGDIGADASAASAEGASDYEESEM